MLWDQATCNDTNIAWGCLFQGQVWTDLNITTGRDEYQNGSKTSRKHGLFFIFIFSGGTHCSWAAHKHSWDFRDKQAQICNHLLLLHNHSTYMCSRGSKQAMSKIGNCSKEISQCRNPLEWAGYPVLRENDSPCASSFSTLPSHWGHYQPQKIFQHNFLCNFCCMFPHSS